MKLRAILKSLLFAYLITGIFLVLLALLLFQTGVEENVITIGILIGYVLSSFAGGFMSGKILRKDKYLWGTIAGLSYCMILMLVSWIGAGKWDMTFRHTITVFFMCAGGGMLGGMFS